MACGRRRRLAPAVQIVFERVVCLLAFAVDGRVLREARALPLVPLDRLVVIAVVRLAIVRLQNT